MSYELRIKNKKYFSLTSLTILFCLTSWSYRIFSLNQIISFGELGDFRGYYQVAQLIINQQITPDKLLATSFGPPFVYLPFLIFTIFPFKFAEYLLTLLNLVSYFTVFYLLWKKAKLSINWKFWGLLGMLSFSFPIIFSLGMGNLIGIVTLGIYSLWIFKKDWLKWLGITLAFLLKIFPIIIIIPYLILKLFNYSSKPSAGWRMRDEKLTMNNSLPVFHRDRAIFILLIVSLFLLHLILFNNFNIWLIYIQSLVKIFNQGSLVISVYNQSLSAVLGRWGINNIWYYLTVVLLLSIVIWITRKTLRNHNKLFPLSIFYLSLILLVQPISWQYYFALLLPFIIIQIGKGKTFYLLILFLISLDGNRLQNLPFLGSLFLNSQFWGNLAFFIYTSQILLNPQSDGIINQ